MLGVYADGGAEIVTNDDASGCGDGSRATFDATRGAHFQIAVDSPDATAAAFKLSRTSPPVNNAFEDAAVLSTDRWAPGLAGTTLGATAQSGEPAHAGTAATKSVWYRVDVPSETSARAFAYSTCYGSPGVKTRMAVYRGTSLTTLVHVASARPDMECDNGSVASWWHPAGAGPVTYWIAVDAVDAQGPFSIYPTSAAANDALAAPTAVYTSTDGNGYASGDLGVATLEPGERDHGAAGHTGSLWFQWRAVRAGRAELDVCGSTRGATPGEVGIAVYQGADAVAAGVMPLDCDAATGSPVTFTAQAGAVYSVALTRGPGAGGYTSIKFSLQPANDDRANARLILPSESAVVGTTAAATREPGEPKHAGIEGQGSVWYRWVAPADQRAVFDMCNYYSHPILAVYTEREGEVEPVAAPDSGGCGSTTDGSRVTFDAVKGTQYLIAVDARGDAGFYEDFLLRLPPANDDFAGAMPLEAGQTASEDLARFTAQAGEPAHLGEAARASAWYRVTVPRRGIVTLRACNSLTRLAVYAGDELADARAIRTTPARSCGDQGGPAVRFQAVPGKTYRVAVDVEGTRRPHAFSLQTTLAPANDQLVAALDLGRALSASQYGSTADASLELGEPEHGDADGTGSVWYAWRPYLSGTASADTCQYPSAATALAVYRQTGVGMAGLERVTESGAGSSCGPNGNGVRLSFRVEPDTTYYLAVDSPESAYFSLRTRFGPPNDDMVNASYLDRSGDNGTTTGAGREPGEANHAPSGGSASVWYRWTASHSGQARIDTCRSPGFATALAVYRQTGTGHAGLLRIGASAGGGACSEPNGGLVRFQAVAGVTYYVAIDGRSGASGDFHIDLQYAQSNDTLALAALIPADGGEASGSTVEATHQAGEPDHAGGGSAASVWHKWVAPYDTHVQIDTCESAFDTVLAAYTTTSSIAGLTKVAAADDTTACGPGGKGSRVAYDAVEGTVYWIAVDGHGGATGDYVLRLLKAPRNDWAERADLAPIGTTVEANTEGATSSTGEPVHGGPGGASVWYRVVAPHAGTMVITTCGSSYDTLLAVYSGTPGMLSQVTTNDDNPRCGGGTSRVTFPVLAGAQYYVAVDGRNAATGDLRLTVDPPANDDFDDAEAMSGRPTSTAGTTISTGIEVGEPASGSRSVWFKWTAPASRTVAMSTCGSDATASLGVFKGNDVAHLDSIASTATVCPGGVRREVAVTAGTTYRLQVATGADGGGVQIHVDAPVNDDFGDAQTLASAEDVTAAGSIAGAGKQPGEPSHGSSSRVRSVWYRWTAPATAQVTAKTCGSATPTVVRAFGGSFYSPLTQVASSCPGGAGGTATSFMAVGGTDYRIAVDGAGEDAGPFTLRLTQTTDLEPPITRITDAPDSPTNAASVTYSFEANEAATYRCKLDEDPDEPCSSPRTLIDVGEGTHIYRVWATDTSGNVEEDPAEAEFTIDRTPPTTRISGGPLGEIHASVPDVEITADEPITRVDCKIDGKTAPCAFSPVAYTPGSHTLSAVATDIAGNVDPTPAETTFTIVNADPDVDIDVSPTTGAAPVDVTVGIDASDADDDLLRYRVDWGDESTPADGYFPPDEPLTHTYDHQGVYVVAVEVRDPWTTQRSSQVVIVAKGEPLKADAGDDRVGEAGQAIAFDGGASRPTAGIDRYHWTFGDGTTGEGRTASHVYPDAGTYTAKLTVTRDDEMSVDTAVVRVGPASPLGLGVTVFSKGAKVSGADVALIDADGRRYSGATDADGAVRLRGVPDGTYSVYAFKSGLTPAVKTVTVAGGAGALVFDLEPGSVATTDLTSRPLTIDEINAAGIDTTDPANQNAVEFEAVIALGSARIPIKGISTRTGFWGTRIGSEICVRSFCRFPVAKGWGYVSSHWVDDKPMLTTIVVPFRATWLKEFFDVSLSVTNLAPAGFTLRAGKATFQPPDGLPLAPTASPQSQTVAVPDIPGGESRTVSWIVRGDKEGLYDLSATYAGRLDPTGAPVNILASTREPLKVWGGSAIKFIVETDDQVERGHPVNVRVGMQNVADVSIYNASVELLKDGRLNYIEQPRQQRSFDTSEIKPGTTWWSGDFVLVPKVSGTVDLSKSFVRKTAGDASLDAEVKTHERTPAIADDPQLSTSGRKDSVVLEFDEVPGVEDYEVYASPDADTDFGAAPLATRALGASSGHRKVILAAPADTTQVFAVSAVHDGHRTLLHPVATGKAKTDETFPYVGFDGACRSDERHVYATIADLDVGLDRWQYKLGDADWIDGESIKGKGQVNVWVPLPNPAPTPPRLQVRAANADQAATGPDVWGPTVSCTIIDRSNLGYGFKNRALSDYVAGAGISTADILNDATVGTTFGDLQPSDGSAYDDAIALMSSTMNGGLCFGLALSGALFDAGIDQMSDAAAGRPDAEWSVSDESLLPEPDRLLSRDKPEYTKQMLRLLAGTYMAQWDVEYSGGVARQMTKLKKSSDPAALLRERIRSAMDSGTDADSTRDGRIGTGLALIYLNDKGKDNAHEVVATAVDDAPGGGFTIEVWDNNLPKETNEIEVGSDGHWTYGPLGYSGRFSDDNYLVAGPLFAPRRLQYFDSSPDSTHPNATVADLPPATSLTSAESADGSEATLVKQPADLNPGYAGSTAAFAMPSGTVTLAGASPAITFRGSGVSMAVAADNPGGPVEVDFDAASASIRAGSPVDITIMRDGASHTAVGVTAMSVAGDGTVTTTSPTTPTPGPTTSPTPDPTSPTPGGSTTPGPGQGVLGATATPTPTPTPRAKPASASIKAKSVKRKKKLAVLFANVADGASAKISWKAKGGGSKGKKAAKAASGVVRVVRGKAAARVPKQRGRYVVTVKLGAKKLVSKTIRVA